MVVKKSSRRVGRPRGSRNRKSKPSRKTSKRSVGRPRGSRKSKPSRKTSKRSVGRPRGSRSRKSKPSRKTSKRSVGRPRGSRNRKSKPSSKGGRRYYTIILNNKFIPVSKIFPSLKEAKEAAKSKGYKLGTTHFVDYAIDLDVLQKKYQTSFGKRLI